MLEAEIGALLSAQSPRGAFVSTVGDVVDETCFVTAQVALILAGLSRSACGPALERALDFVEACAAPAVPGAFSFYPPGLDSPRLAIALPPDADDTALAWLALMRGGRRSRAEAQAVLPALFDGLRVLATRRGDAPWVRGGVYRTWFQEGLRNPADLCVNANILAALAEAGCVLSQAVVAIVENACRGGPSQSSLRALAPFYAHAAELEIALERAVESGAAQLSSAWAMVGAAGHDQADRLAGRPAERPLYCNWHGRPLWRSASLQRARRCHDLARALHHSTTAMGDDDAVYA